MKRYLLIAVIFLVSLSLDSTVAPVVMSYTQELLPYAVKDGEVYFLLIKGFNPAARWGSFVSISSIEPIGSSAEKRLLEKAIDEFGELTRFSYVIGAEKPRLFSTVRCWLGLDMWTKKQRNRFKVKNKRYVNSRIKSTFTYKKNNYSLALVQIDFRKIGDFCEYPIVTPKHIFNAQRALPVPGSEWVPAAQLLSLKQDEKKSRLFEYRKYKFEYRGYTYELEDHFAILLKKNATKIGQIVGLPPAR